MITRRAAIAGLVGVCGFSSTAIAAQRTLDGLRDHAGRRGLTYGCAVRESLLSTSQPMREAVVREAAMVVAEFETKWRPTAPAPDRTDYAASDAILDFAAGQGLSFRGHTLVWHQNPPVWAMPRLHGREGEELVFSHIRDIVGHYRGRVVEWDVVNEAIHVPDGRPGGLRDWGPYERGYDFIADCFRLAHECDPDAVLCYNDFGLEYDRADFAAKRRATLDLVEQLKRRGAPIHALGIQSHLVAWYPFGPAVFRRFLADVADLGLKIRLTELDVNDQRVVGGDIPKRDRFQADHVRRYLDAALDERAVSGVLTWGLTDAFNRSLGFPLRPDGSIQRIMPLDEEFRRKPLWYAIANAFDEAPQR